MRSIVRLLVLCGVVDVCVNVAHIYYSSLETNATVRSYLHPGTLLGHTQCRGSLRVEFRVYLTTRVEITTVIDDPDAVPMETELTPVDVTKLIHAIASLPIIDGQSVTLTLVGSTLTSTPTGPVTSTTTMNTPSSTMETATKFSTVQPTSPFVYTSSVTSASTSTSKPPTTSPSTSTSALPITSPSTSPSTSTSTTATTTDCETGEFRCLKKPECVDTRYLCDGAPHCQDGTDEWFGCDIPTEPREPLELEVRLMYDDVESPSDGRVEVRRDGGVWGTVCDDMWDTSDAAVVCRMLNHSIVGHVYAYTAAHFGEGVGPVWLGNVRCHGDESNLGDCQSRGFYETVHCTHRQDASVSCGCSTRQFDCGDSCVTLAFRCDRIVQCTTGVDEDPELCALLVTEFRDPTSAASVLESPEYHVSAPSCVVVSYMGDVAVMYVTAVYGGQDKDDVTFGDLLVPSPEIRSVSFPIAAGNVQLEITIEMTYDSAGVTDTATATFGLRRIRIVPGSDCSGVDLDCPAGIPHSCRDSSYCFTTDQSCDLVEECMDGSDETEYTCHIGIPCDFEDVYICGYYPELWQHQRSTQVTRPNMDHTVHMSGQGHFMTSKPAVIAYAEERWVTIGTLYSPVDEFAESGCLTFWYKLNASNHQPATLSAQILVYLQYGDTEDKHLLWYDHVDRPFRDWMQGGVPVIGGRRVRIIVTARTTLAADTYTGVVALDDVQFLPGQCDVIRPECDHDMFECESSPRVCIPHYFVCDGTADCDDDSDERICDRPEGAYTLVSGDGSYGKLAYYHGGAWQPVCHPADTDGQTYFNVYLAPDICRSLGLFGNSELTKDYIWDKPADHYVHVNCNSTGHCAHITSEDPCSVFAFLKCSNSVCFSGEKLCPGTVSTCAPVSYFCDGRPDCPDDGDEHECYCFDGEESCHHVLEDCSDVTCHTCEDRGMFQCMDHQCVSPTSRCDGVTDCRDGTDEYRCLQIGEDNMVTMYDNVDNMRKPVCIDDVTASIANHICRLTANGYFDEIHQGSEPVTGGLVVVKSLHQEQVIPGYSFDDHASVCFALQLTCQLPECGTTARQDSVVQPFIIGGRAADTGDWPWQGELLVGGVAVCGATLIHPSWALTTAHCANRWSSGYSVLFGFGLRRGPDVTLQEIPVSIVCHDQFDSVDYIHDLAILELQRPVLVDNYTRPVCLGTDTTLHDIGDGGGEDMECYVTGLGTTHRYFIGEAEHGGVQERRVEIIPHGDCKAAWAAHLGRDGQFADDVICVASDAPYSPTCFGDSGGPLVCKNVRGHWELLGVTSFGYGYCEHDTMPTVFTLVPRYTDWISRVTGLRFAQDPDVP